MLTDRRSVLKSLGFVAGGAAALGHVPTAARAQTGEYDVIRLDPGERRTVELGDGETFANTLVDITAEGADFRVIADGDGWTIRNVGIRGQSNQGEDVGSFDYHFYLRGSGDWEGTFENVYLGDGSGSGVRKGAIYVFSDGTGHVRMRNIHVAEFAGLGIYAATFADGPRPTIGVENSYFRDNGNTHLRIAKEGTYVEDTVIHNTGRVPAQPDGAVVSRGLWPWEYGTRTQTVEVRNCDLDFTAQGRAVVARQAFDATKFHLIGGNVAGPLIGPRPERIELTDVGDDPDTTIPDGVPQSPEEAASGGSGKRRAALSDRYGG